MGFDAVCSKIMGDYKSQVKASKVEDEVRNNLIDWLKSDNSNKLLDAIIHKPEEIDDAISDFKQVCERQSSQNNKVVEESSLLSFADYANNPLNEGKEEDSAKDSEKFEDEVKDSYNEKAEDVDYIIDRLSKKGIKLPKSLIEDENDKGEELPESVISSVIYAETSGIRHNDFDWYKFEGSRRKKYKWGKSEWVVKPGGIIGLSKACDVRNKHSFVILDQSKTSAIDMDAHRANLLKKRCKPFSGSINSILTPTPNSGRVATASSDVTNIIDSLSVKAIDENSWEFTDNTRKLAIKDFVKYLSKLYKVEPMKDGEGSEEKPFSWSTDEGEIILKYLPENRFVVSRKA